MFEYPQYDENGQERLFFGNLWRDTRPQHIVGADCFVPQVNLNPDENLIVLKLSAIEFTEIFSSLRNGAEKTYPERFMQIMVNFLKGLHCPPEMVEQECFDYPSYAAFITYSPMNPFLTPDEVPEGYETAPFVVNGDLPTPRPEYELSDVFVPFDSLTLDVNWFEDISGQLPTVQIMVNGAGKAFLKFLPQIQGGLVCVTLDEPPNLLDILIGVVTGAENLVDLNMDIVSLPPETAKEIMFPVDVVGTGIHTIYAVFLPIIDDSFIPVRFGGGFRGVQLCNFVEVPTMGIESVRFNGDDCVLETLTDGVWTPVEGWADIDSCIVPETLSVESVNAALPSAENFAGLSGAVDENTEAIAEQETEINNLTTNVTQTNIVPSPSTLEGDEICNAASYMADKIIEIANQTWEDSGDLTISEFLEALLTNSNGWYGTLISDLYNAAVPANSSTPANLAFDRQRLIDALYCNELDKEATKTAITASAMADTSKDLFNAAIDAVTDAKWALWAYVGNQTTTGTCDCTPPNTKIFNFTLGSQLGWAANNIGTGARAVWAGNGWDAANMGGYFAVAIEKSFTWPTDFVITESRVWIGINDSAIPYQYVYGLPYANGTFGLNNPIAGQMTGNTDIVKGTRTGIGVEYSKTLDTGQFISRIEFDWTGTEPSW